MLGPAVASLAALVIGAGAAAALDAAPRADALTLPIGPPTTVPVTPPPPAGPQSVGYGYDPAHDFAAADPGITLPLGSLWSIKTPGDPVALLAADGVDLVVVDTPNATAPTGATIEGLDPNSGAQAWSSPAPANAQIAYAAGIVAVAGDGHVQAYNYGIGVPAWNVPLAGVSAVTAADGNFYVDAAGTIEAINATTGAIEWTTKPSSTGAAGPLGVSGDTVYRAESSQVYAFSRINGKLLWRQGSAGTAASATLWSNDVFRPGFAPGPSIPGTVLNGGPLAAATGLPTSGTAAQIVSGNVGLQTNGTGVVAANLSSGTTLWSSVDQPLAILNSEAVLASVNGGLQLRNLTTGALDWSATLPSSATTFPTAVGNQELLVSTTGQLAALVPARYARITTTIVVRKPFAVYGGAPATGTVTSAEPGIALAQQLQIAAKPWPSKQYGAATRVTTNATGKLAISERPSFNTTYRISPAGSTKALGTFKIVALPRVTYKLGRPTSGGRTVAVAVRVPSAVKLGHHRVSLYLASAKRRRYVLLGGGTLEGRGGVFGASFPIAVGRPVSGKDFITACLAGVYKQGMSFGNRFDRSCGVKQISF